MKNTFISHPPTGCAHSVFKHGEKASDRTLKKRMSSMSKIFHEAPGRCADYITVTDAMEKDYPMQFITHRLVENDMVVNKQGRYGQKLLK